MVLYIYITTYYWLCKGISVNYHNDFYQPRIGRLQRKIILKKYLSNSLFFARRIIYKYIDFCKNILWYTCIPNLFNLINFIYVISFCGLKPISPFLMMYLISIAILIRDKTKPHFYGFFHFNYRQEWLFKRVI